jgi:hypothetical protein
MPSADQFDPEVHMEENDWNVEKYLLPETHPEYGERHALSLTIEAYEKAVEACDNEPVSDSYDDAEDWAL